MLRTVSDLLVAKPELERRLLQIIINKLVCLTLPITLPSSCFVGLIRFAQGDPERRVCSHAVSLLSQLCMAHPNMKMVVVKEAEQELFRPNVPERAQYVAICCCVVVVVFSFAYV